MLEESQQTDRCMFCNAVNKLCYTDLGEIVCERCGCVVAEDSVNYSYKEPAYNEEEKRDRERTGYFEHLIYRPFNSTTIGPIGPNASANGIASVGSSSIVDVKNKKLTPEAEKRMKRLIALDKTCTKNQQGHVANVLLNWAKKLNIPLTIADRAYYLYLKCRKMRLDRGRHYTSIAAAMLYIACKEAKLIWNMKEIAQVTGVSPKSINRVYVKFMKKIEEIEEIEGVEGQRVGVGGRVEGVRVEGGGKEEKEKEEEEEEKEKEKERGGGAVMLHAPSSSSSPSSSYTYTYSPSSLSSLLPQHQYDETYIQKIIALIVHRLRLPEFITRLALEILQEFKTENLYVDVIVSKHPRSVAGALVYLAYKHYHNANKRIKITQADISQVTGVTEITIRNMYRRLNQYQNIITRVLIKYNKQ